MVGNLFDKLQARQKVFKIPGTEQNFQNGSFTRHVVCAKPVGKQVVSIGNCIFKLRLFFICLIDFCLQSVNFFLILVDNFIFLGNLFVKCRDFFIVNIQLLLHQVDLVQQLVSTLLTLIYFIVFISDLIFQLVNLAFKFLCRFCKNLERSCRKEHNTHGADTDNSFKKVFTHC